MTTADLVEGVALGLSDRYRIATEAPEVGATLLARVMGRAGEAGQARGCERRGEAGAVDRGEDNVVATRARGILRALQFAAC